MASLAKPATCRLCPYFSIGRGFVPDLIPDPQTCEALFIGEAPGETERVDGRPFCGGTGNYLVALTRRAELLSALTAKEHEAEKGIPERLLRKHHFGLANVIRCQPPKNHYPTGKLKKHAEDCCRQYDVALPAAQVIITLGQHSFRLFKGPHKGGITLWRGSVLPIQTSAQGVAKPWGQPGAISSWQPSTTIHDWSPNWSKRPAERVSELSSAWLVPTLHPAALMRNPKGWPAVINDLEKAKRILDHGWIPPVKRSILLHSVKAVQSVLPKLVSESRKRKQPIIIDIENTTGRIPVLECIGFCLEPPTGFCLPLTRISGEAYWTKAEYEQVKALVTALCATAYIGTHHGMHDVPLVERDFGPITHWVADTLYIHAACYGELSHKLAFVQSTFSDYPQHKSIMKLEDDKGVK